MSLILHSTSTAAEAAAKAPRTSVMTESESKADEKLMKSPVVPATRLFSGAIIHGGHLNVTINTVNQSPTSISTERKSFKRIRRG